MNTFCVLFTHVIYIGTNSYTDSASDSSLPLDSTRLRFVPCKVTPLQITKYAQALNNRLRPRLTPPQSNTIDPISWKLEAGSWKLEAGSWKLEAGSWKLKAEPTHMHICMDQHACFCVWLFVCSFMLVVCLFVCYFLSF